MIRRGKSLFSSAKYFLDQKYKNYEIRPLDNSNGFEHLAPLSQLHNIGVTYLEEKVTSTNSKILEMSVEVKDHEEGQSKLSLSNYFPSHQFEIKQCSPIKVPWFPTKFSHLDLTGKHSFFVKDVQNNKQHPCFTDVEYGKRRSAIAQASFKFKMGDPFPDPNYSSQEHQLWKKLLQDLREIQSSVMNKRFLMWMEKAVNQLKYNHGIPKIKDCSDYIQSATGFQIKPVHGMLSQRQFLNCLAFKVFCCSQYIRHYKFPDYSPEPDIIHEFIGHIPMFADPYIASISQQLGLLSLGASDEQIAQLATLYFYTIEFGFCMEKNQKKAYGAGVAGCIGEMEFIKSPQAKFKPFEPQVDAFDDSYPIQTYQSCYRVSQSLEKSLEQLVEYGKSMKKKTRTKFNPVTKQIQYDRNIEAEYTGDKGPLF